MVPVLALERLMVTAPTHLPQGSEFIVALVAGDGTVLVERDSCTLRRPRRHHAHQLQSGRDARATNADLHRPARWLGIVSTDPSDRKVGAPVPTKEERAQAERLVGQGERHLADGNVSVARQYFLRAAEQGLAIAALKMAETHDPRALLGVNVRGLVPDPAEAKKWMSGRLSLALQRHKLDYSGWAESDSR